MIREIASIISASPSPLEQLSKARDSDSLARLFAEVRQARTEREGIRSKEIATRSGQIANLEDHQVANAARSQKAQTAASSVQSVANQHFGSDTVTFSAHARQLLELPSNLVPPNPTFASQRNGLDEVEQTHNRKRTRALGGKTEQQAENSKNGSQSSDESQADSVESKARDLIAGLRSDFEAPVSNRRSRTAPHQGSGAIAAEAPAASIRSLKNGTIDRSSTTQSGRSGEPTALTSKLGPLAGLKIEKDDTGSFTITKLPNRVEIGGRRFDLSNGAIQLNRDGSVDASGNGTPAPSVATQVNGSENGLLGLAVRGDSNVKLAPKDGKISATAASEGEIEVSGIKVRLDTGTSILVGAAPQGRIAIDESETRISLGKQTVTLRGGQSIRFGGSEVQTVSGEQAQRPPKSTATEAAAASSGFRPLFKSVAA